MGGVVGAFLKRRFEQQKQTNEHDIKIYNQSNEILSEEKLLNIANFEVGASKHAIRYDNYSLLENWCTFFERAGNQYLDKQTREQSKRLRASFLILIKFIRLNFSEIKHQNPNNENIYLRPDLNPDYEDNATEEQFAEWKEFARELDTLIDEVLDQYSKYRETVKKKLKI